MRPNGELTSRNMPLVADPTLAYSARMRLVRAHRILILTAIGACLILMTRAVVLYARDGDPPTLISGLLGALGFLGLGMYWRWFQRKKLGE